jgi:hypothetical protein
MTRWSRTVAVAALGFLMTTQAAWAAPARTPAAGPGWKTPTARILANARRAGLLAGLHQPWVETVPPRAKAGLVSATVFVRGEPTPGLDWAPTTPKWTGTFALAKSGGRVTVRRKGPWREGWGW